jgi:hypothetical protein
MRFLIVKKSLHFITVSHYSQLNCFVGFFYDKRESFYILFILLLCSFYISFPILPFTFLCLVAVGYRFVISLRQCLVKGKNIKKIFMFLCLRVGWGDACRKHFTKKLRLKVELINQNEEKKKKKRGNFTFVGPFLFI